MFYDVESRFFFVQGMKEMYKKKEENTYFMSFRYIIFIMCIFFLFACSKPTIETALPNITTDSERIVYELPSVDENIYKTVACNHWSLLGCNEARITSDGVYLDIYNTQDVELTNITATVTGSCSGSAYIGSLAPGERSGAVRPCEGPINVSTFNGVLRFTFEKQNTKQSLSLRLNGN